MTTFIQESYSPGESVVQRTRKITLIRAHAARVGHASRRQQRQPMSLRGVDCDDGKIGDASEKSTRPRESLVKTVANVAIDSVPTHIGNTRKDPFQCYPFPLQANEHVLVDYSVHILPYRFYGLSRPSTSTLAVNFFRDIVFPLALQDAVSFRSFVLAISAVHRADMAHASTSPEMEYQQFLSLRMLRNHFLANPDDCSDAAIAMCLFRGVLEAAAGYEQHGTCLTHMQQVARLVWQRGGPRALQQNPSLLVAVNAYHYTAHDVGDLEEMIFFDWDLHPNSGDLYQSIAEQARLQAKLLCEDFIHFVGKVTLLSMAQRSSAFRKLVPLRHTVFGADSYVTEMLSSWEHSSQSSWETTRTSFVWTRNQQIYGMSLLLHLNAALWEFRNDVARLGEFLNDFRLRMKRLQRDNNRSIEAAAHAMLPPPSDPALEQSHFDRLWHVGKLLKIAKRLDTECWHQLREMLYSSLTFQHCQVNSTWRELFRTVVLSMPSRSWILAGKLSPQAMRVTVV